MRAIKFRAWDKEREVMMPDINLLCSTQHQSAWIGNNGGGCFINPVAEGFVIQQFTGLKDKNGMEIYEGDIVQRVRHPSERFEVGFLEDDFAGGHIPNYFGFPYYSYPEEWKIIGNCFENPELLTNTN